MTSVSVSLSMREYFSTQGVNPFSAYLFSNGKAQLPLRVLVTTGDPDVSVTDYGICTNRIATDLTKNVPLDARLLASTSNGNDRVWQGHPENGTRTDDIPYEEAYDMLLTTDANASGLPSDTTEPVIVDIMAWAKLENYKATPTSAAETIYIYSNINASNSTNAQIYHRQWCSIYLRKKPAIIVDREEYDISAFGTGGDYYNQGQIVLIKGSYKGFSYPFSVSGNTPTVNEYYDGSNIVSPAPNGNYANTNMEPSNSSSIVNFHYFQRYASTTQRFIVRGVFHSQEDSGTITDSLNSSGSMYYKFNAIDKISSFGYYYSRKDSYLDNLHSDDASVKVYGTYYVTATDIYGDAVKASASLTTEYGTSGGDFYPSDVSYSLNQESI